MNLAAIIVTFNRRDDFLRCFEAVLNQSKKPSVILVVNNASTDDTLQEFSRYLNLDYISELKDKTQILCEKNGVKIVLINNSKNTGGSGGFHTGLKVANEELGADYFWLMDDDGYPSENCLETLLNEVDKYDYIMPVSIDINNHEKLSWPTRKKNKIKVERYDELFDSWGKIMNHVTPFNGVLLTKKCVEEVGYINKDFFIWGDDYEHYYRCLKKNINPVTLMKSIFYHPAQKVNLEKIFFGLMRVPYSPSDLRMVCMTRNWTYIYLHYGMIWKIPVRFLMYGWFFIITRKLDFKGFKLYCACVKDGFKGDFTRHWKYLKK